jgi:glutamate-1-semialdehyde 2,1-aminomutase
MTPQATQTQSLAQRYEAEFPTSKRLAETARAIFPNGVTHDLRHLEPFPIYIERASGAYKWDVDGHQLLDFWTGHGSLLLGHSHPDIVAAVQQQMARGTHYGGCHELEIEWGRLVQQLVHSAEKVRFVGSGTEATLMALRLARIFTGKPKVLKFAGHFHGWQDYLVSCADPPLDNPAVPGIPDEVIAQTVIIPPNDPEAVDAALASNPDIGCVILEPTGGHFGVVPIRGPFLHALRDLTRRHGRLLIFDEVITGFRVHPGGAQGYYGVTPDLTTLAKVLAGGLPGGCVAGRGDILEFLEFRPNKPKMKHPGTFNANPLSAAAGIAALKLVATGEPTRRANDMARLLRQQLNQLFAARQVNWLAYGDFSGFKILSDYAGPRPTGDDFIPYAGDLHKLERPRDQHFTHAFRQAMLLCGVDTVGPAGMLMSVHTEADVARTVQAVDTALDWLTAEGVV